MKLSDYTDYKGRPLFAGMDIKGKHFCGGCVRYTQDWRNPERYHCSGALRDGAVCENTPACKDYWDRKAQTEMEEEYARKDEEERQEKIRQNWNKPPLPAFWEKDYLVYQEKESGAMPFCPNCGEPLYDTDRCYFCGQKILQDKEMENFMAPPSEEHLDCPVCGGKGTFVCIRSKYNGHRHGRCSRCGSAVME